MADEAGQVAQEENRLAGIGGWLILLAFGVIVSPVASLWALITVAVGAFGGGRWAALAQPGGVAYHPMWGPTLLFELVANLAMTALTLLVAVLFFRKSTRLPKLFIGVLLAALVVRIVDVLLASQIPALEEPTALSVLGIVRAFLICLIWVPYFRVSKRVKATFVH